RFWGPTYIHNPAGPLEEARKLPLDEVFHIAFTTEALKPKSLPGEYEVLPDDKLNISRLEHKINLTDKSLSTPICPNNTRNRTYGGKKYSSWKYIGPLLYKDEAGEIPAGCPEPDNDFTGGTAFLKGRRIDPATGVFSVVSVGKFGSRPSLSLAFQNITIFIAMNGWACNPQGDEKDFEGAKCFESTFNDRDADAQFSIIKGY
ncbi:MAG: hypothetical protein U1D33_00805, partial [bacterium]|nr:hypothetical protein [bacterium]